MLLLSKAQCLLEMSQVFQIQLNFSFKIIIVLSKNQQFFQSIEELFQPFNSILRALTKILKHRLGHKKGSSKGHESLIINYEGSGLQHKNGTALYICL